MFLTVPSKTAPKEMFFIASFCCAAIISAWIARRDTIAFVRKASIFKTRNLSFKPIKDFASRTGL